MKCVNPSDTQTNQITLKHLLQNSAKTLTVTECVLPKHHPIHVNTATPRHNGTKIEVLATVM